MKRRTVASITALIITGTIGLGAIFEVNSVDSNQPPEGNPERIAEVMEELRKDMGSKYMVDESMNAK